MKSAKALLIHRRPRVERQILAILRGGEGMAELDRSIASSFSQLRRLARREGYVVLQRDAGFLSSDELVLLAWLAMGQRRLTPGCRKPTPPELAAAISECSTALESLKLRLYPLTFYTHWVRA
jgi:hypothetical protein